jgi:RNA polymerase sigma-70 factor (ECF subfamily)
MGMPEPPPEVLEGFAAGDLGAFEALFRQFQGEVYGWVLRIVRDPPAAEELTVETFWRMYRARARFDPGRSFGAWARRVATNAALDHLKSTRGKPSCPTVQVPAGLPGGPSPLAAPDPAVQREIRERTQSAFRQLPAKLQLVATLALIEERPHREIAEALDMSTAAVKARLFRAVRLLRRKLKNLRTNHE